MPNSILWVGLVVLWVFVLFPMLADRHPRIRRTTDAALSTRVLHRGGTKRKARSGPAAGHDSDPDWIPARRQHKLPPGSSLDEHDAEDRMTTSADEPVTESGAGITPEDAVGAGENAGDERDFESGDFEDRAAGEPATGTAMARIPPATASARPARVADGEPAELDESDAGGAEFVPSRRGRGGFDPEADAIAHAARYRFRQRVALGLVLSALIFGALGLVTSALLWWGCALSVVALGGYLGYLRRQVRLEAEIRRRRAARLARGRQQGEAAGEAAAPAVEDAERAALDRDSARVLRRRAVVLDVDDEDPTFEHLELFDAAAARATRKRAAGGEMRRAAGE